MMTANNGILIVVLTFALGLNTGNHLLTALAFAMAGVSYLANMSYDLSLNRWGQMCAWIAIGLGLFSYVVVFKTLLGV
jgi:hypothetical protein